MKKQVLIILLIFLLQNIINNLGHPVTPAFVRSLDISDYMFGVFFASMSFGLMIGGPIWGILGDYGNKKRYIVLGIVLYSVGQFFFGYSNHPVWMVVARFVSGFGIVASMTLLISLMIEISHPKDRAKHLSYTAATTVLGGSIGYWVGGFIATNPFFVQLLHTDDLKRQFLVQSSINLLFAVLVFFILTVQEETVVKTTRPSIISGLKDISKMDVRLLLFLISLVFVTIGSTNLSKYIDVYFDELGYNPQQLGTFVMTTGLVSLFASVLLAPPMAKLKKQLSVIIIIHILSAAIVLFVFRAPQFLITIYTVYMFYVILKAIYLPLEQNYISSQAKDGKYGSILGVRQSFISIGMVIGPLIGGFLYEINALVVFDVSAYVFLIGALLLLVAMSIKNKPQLSETV